jgi:uncharacterized protein YjiS (DUF1127 family)
MTLTPAASHTSCQPKPASLLGRIHYMLVLARQRQELATLDAHLLADIGVTPRQALKECAKAPWDVPQHWRC